MARFLLAWEIGGGLGHVTPLVRVARQLLVRGHSVDLVLRDLTVGQSLPEALTAAAPGVAPGAARLRVWQAPLWQARLAGLPPAANYTELLFHSGYLDGQRLLGLARGWRSLLEALQPALLLAEHSPTALLASRGLPMRRAVIGNGFFMPPAQVPLPPFTPQPVPAERLRQGEQRVLAACQQVLAGLGVPARHAPAAVHELVAADTEFRLTWPELDPYGPGPGAATHPAAGDAPSPGPRRHTLGPMPADAGGAQPEWPAGDAPPLLAYLKGDYPLLEPVLQALSAAPWRTLAHVPGLPVALRQRLSGPRLRFSEAPLAMGPALAQARAVLCHGGAGVLAEALGAGRPLLLLPMHGEQQLNARRAVATGAALALAPGEVAAQLPAALARLHATASLYERAQAFAARHPASPADAVAARVADACEALVADGGTPLE
jgi:UDP:flavonoid glycosyltransferase YjiC (YdhE family)